MLAISRKRVSQSGRMSVTVTSDETGTRSVDLWAGSLVVFSVDHFKDGRVADADGRQLGTLDEVKAALAAMVKAL